MPTKIWCRDQSHDTFFKGELAYKCYRARTRVWLPADIAPGAPFLTDSIIADLKAIAAERVGP